MKKFYPLLFVAFYGTAGAQLSQSTHAPANGETYSMWDCGTNANPGSSGTNVTWNFAGLTTNSTAVSNFSAVTTTNGNYPNANVTVSSSASNVSHYKSTSSNLQYYGGNISVGSSVAGTLTYTDAAIEAVYPFSLNTVTTAPISGTVQVTIPFPLGGTFTGTSKATLDGVGTLLLPGGGSYNNVFRVVTSQTINISAGASALVVKESYNYYAPGIKAPVVSILTATATPQGGAASTQTIVSRNTNALGVTSTTTSVREAAADLVQVYPNPANDVFAVRTGSEKSMVFTLTDITGKIVSTQMVTGSALINTASLPEGIYIYSLASDGNKVSTGKLTVAH
jgi:hypothetical protein